ncbi:hypothetical protein [Saccharopolyspora gloriosae]|uniref:hypothetical protein n=1 Tax=Saccharopolyspora gloriosae TaxID=455344 RepID=UPI001FB7C5C6|nr:hypothetical protein [Saccharopolyspora gloriosae]
MITRIAVVPYPPLLVPELTVRSNSLIEPVRSACLRAATSLTEAATEWVAVGVDRSGPAVVEAPTAGTFAGYGVDVPVALREHDDSTAPDPDLPLPALIAGFLRAQAGARSVTVRLLAPDTPARQAAELGARLDADGPETALLVLAEGGSRQDERSPHPPDPRAPELDETLRRALRDVDGAGLLGLDSQECAELGVHSRAAWQVAAGVAANGTWQAESLYSGTPLGITYHVGVWSRVA